MSEYRSYEFRAIDRPLDKAAQQQLRALSSRAQITATSFTNSYQWGDFKGEPDALMEEIFDLHLYLANWGSRRLMIRVPERFIDRRVLDTCMLDPEYASARVANGDLILDIQSQEMDVGWDEGPGWLDSLGPLRADLLNGDQRLLYLIWLMGVEFELVDAGAPEPMPGIGPMTGALESFATFFALDPDLVQAAAEREAVAGQQAIAPDAVRAAISGLADDEKRAFLSRLYEGDPHAGAELRTAVTKRLNAGLETTPVTPRTAGDLRARAAAIRIDREQADARRETAERERLALEQEQKRGEKLVAIARRGEGVWRDVETEIERSGKPGYDRAAGLLLDLRAVADERGTLPDFARRIEEIRERHPRKARFLQRIAELA